MPTCTSHLSYKWSWFCARDPAHMWFPTLLIFPSFFLSTVEGDRENYSCSFSSPRPLLPPLFSSPSFVSSSSERMRERQRDGEKERECVGVPCATRRVSLCMEVVGGRRWCLLKLRCKVHTSLDSSFDSQLIVGIRIVWFWMCGCLD